MFVPLCVPRVRPSLKAAANIEIEGTEISASTLHNTFDLDAEGTSKLDFSKPAMDKVAAVLNMQTLLLDEAPVRLCVCARRQAWLPVSWEVVRGRGGLACAGQHDGCRCIGEDQRRPVRR